MIDSRKTVAEMFADWLREASVLVATFGWLDRAVKGEPFSGTWAVEVLGFAAILFALGATLERIRPSR